MRNRFEISFFSRKIVQKYSTNFSPNLKISEKKNINPKYSRLFLNSWLSNECWKERKRERERKKGSFLLSYDTVIQPNKFHSRSPRNTRHEIETVAVLTIPMFRSTVLLFQNDKTHPILVECLDQETSPPSSSSWIRYSNDFFVQRTERMNIFEWKVKSFIKKLLASSLISVLSF